jgi:hypothetical protein
MHPQSVPIGDGLLEAGVIRGESLRKILLPAPAPPQPPEIIRRGDAKKSQE